eukprot:scaffold17106_cov59-Attheya_sp.AAC.2
MSGKEAVVLILDTSPSMNAPYPSNNNHTNNRVSRLSCAKSAMEGMICELMLQSKTNEVGIILLKTRETHHHMTNDNNDDDSKTPLFPNLTELSEIIRPTIHLLRKLRNVQTTTDRVVDDDDTISKASEEDEDNSGVNGAKMIRGDVWDGIVVASDAMYQRTHGKKYARRRIIVFTDAEHEVQVDTKQVFMVADSLYEMKCTFTVIGLDFQRSAEFSNQENDDTTEDDETQSGDEQQHDSDETRSHNSCSDNDHDNIKEEEEEENEEKRLAFNKSTNEELLISLAKLTNGNIIAASTMQEMIASTTGKRIPKSTRRKFEFHIAPGLVVDARWSLLLSKANLPSLKREAILLQDTASKSTSTSTSTKEDDGVLRNGLGEIMTSAVITSTTHWDADDQNVEVGLADRTNCFRYGADLIPLGVFDREGLNTRSPVGIFILGYTAASQVPRAFCMGPPYAISADSSTHRQACVAISALAQALKAQHSVAICSMVKSKHADPIMGALFPLEQVKKNHNDNDDVPHRLFFLQLPFAGDIQSLSMEPLLEPTASSTTTSTTQEDKVVDDLIDSLMLPEDALQSHLIPNPAIRSFHKMVMSRAIEPIIPTNNSNTTTTASTNIVLPTRFPAATDTATTIAATSAQEYDPMAPPPLVSHTRECIETFQNAFPLVPMSEEEQNRQTSKRKFWGDDSNA